MRRLVLLGLFDSPPYCEGTETGVLSVHFVICVTSLMGYPNVKPAAAAASCKSPDEVAIKTWMDRDFQRKRRISETRYRTKEHEQ